MARKFTVHTDWQTGTKTFPPKNQIMLKFTEISEYKTYLKMKHLNPPKTKNTYDSNTFLLIMNKVNMHTYIYTQQSDALNVLNVTLILQWKIREKEKNTWYIVENPNI